MANWQLADMFDRTRTYRANARDPTNAKHLSDAHGSFMNDVRVDGTSIFRCDAVPARDPRSRCTGHV